MRYIVFLFLLLASLSEARANVGVIRKTPTTVEGPWVAQTPVVVESEELSFTFTKEGDDVAAQFEAIYYIVNPTEAQETIVGSFFSPNGAIKTAFLNSYSHHGVDEPILLQPATFFLDGKELAYYIPSGEESAAIQKRLEESDFLSPISVDPRITPTSQRFYLGEEELTNTQALEAIHQQKRIEQALRSSGSFQIVLAPGQKATFKATGRIEGGYSQVNSYSKEALYARHSLMGPEKPPSRDFQFFYALSPIRTWSGAPSIRIEFRYPSNWEIESSLFKGRPRLIKTRETNASNRLTVSPLFTAAAPTAFVFPSFGASVGVPLQASEGGVSLGARLQLDAMLGPVGVVVPIDVFPGLQDRLQISVMGQLSL